MRAQFLEQLELKPDSLSGKTAVVTGAGDGTGRELAIAQAAKAMAKALKELNY